MSKFNFNIDDFNLDNNDPIISLSRVKHNTITQKQLSDLFVDFNLPSGTKWCKYNIGVDPKRLEMGALNWYGDYYAWGETEIKKEYTNENYKFGKSNYSMNYTTFYSKYNNEDQIIELQLQDDAAYQNMNFYGLKFKIPSKKQFDELIKYTRNIWVNDYDPLLTKHGSYDFGIPGLNGRLFVGKTNEKDLLFFPAAGYKHSEISKSSESCFYWTSNINLTRSADGCNFGANKSYVGTINTNSRYSGFSVRPVALI